MKKKAYWSYYSLHKIYTSQELYLYNESGMRIYKKSVGIGLPSESFYLISAGGVMYSIEETEFHMNGNGNANMEQYNIPDLGYEDKNKEINYQIQDHLGNLRLSYTVAHCPTCFEYNCATVDVQYQINYIAEYMAYGGLLREFVRNGTSSEKFLSTGHERDKQTGWDYRQARYYDADLGRFLAVDPLGTFRIWLSPYNYCSNNPILRTDPTGSLDDEFDRNGNRISNLGGSLINFYHQANGDTKVEDQTTCLSNIIKGGEALIRGFTLRDDNVSWATITSEFLTGTGPANSIFADFTGNSTAGPFASLHHAFSAYSAPAREMVLNSNKPKGVMEMDYYQANPILARDMWKQMWGRFNVSWYKLGEITLFMMNDSKSATSLLYRAVEDDWERDQFSVMGNTYQTYLWIESNISIQNKVNQVEELYQRIIQESKRPHPGKL